MRVNLKLMGKLSCLILDLMHGCRFLETQLAMEILGIRAGMHLHPCRATQIQQRSIKQELTGSSVNCQTLKSRK